MAEPVEDDISLLGTRETTEYISPSSDCQVPSTEYHTTGADYQVPEYLPAGALRAPVVPSQPRQERKHSSGRVLPGSGSDRVTPFSSSSPATSPRTPERSPNYNIDASGSTYALQVALRNMKERYHKLQKKMALIEDDNQRLISGKSELFGEIGKLQENSIKLREKNLQLNQEIHTKHQECCSLKEKFSSLSTENMNLTRQLAKTSQENRRLVKQVNHLNDENKRLREKLSLITTQVKALPGGAGLAVSAADVPVPLKTKIVPLSEELDSFDDPPSRFISSYKDTLDEFEQISSNELAGTDSTWSVSDIEDEQLVVSLQLATRRMKDLLSSLQEQHHSLLLLSPLLNSLPPCSSQIVCSQCDTNFEHSHRTLSKDGTLSQRDRDLSTVTITPSTQFEEGTKYEVVDDDGACQSRLATCGSVLNTNFTSAGMNTSPLMDDINGESNIHMDANNSAEDRPHSPFDWRQVQMSDDEGRENDLTRPYTRTVSTSPDPVLEDEEERICPMCNAVFPQVIPQESFESHVVSHFEIENGFEVIA
ncbi:hypothetical protein OTU49_000701 [Cherax quadricarinatus]|uniref:UBZ1-type domain-containing protein n=1 Tax=Cherax quadricarinatus TaxID=27406 RepID=A0AAW0XI65_CHEQU|nr:uncharacterized protein LOC128689766 isoform X1 [Cherax quadricarinatus]XP_053634195.1 uncharacterized protein LOC128689766 isoform X1 [Cherax quadricarinatus]XP_053634196.1 uncharacterized protein LOC128689766 isoform X1 [Cherax quadricarinatus]XP_053634197.1 uncharacterized protein LOC128689766 isoform X1 [Cherax quadricarinatus]